MNEDSVLVPEVIPERDRRAVMRRVHFVMLSSAGGKK
jgi:hypothetical protein